MGKSLSLTATGESYGVFECPNCKQTIDVTATKCRFCSTQVDASAAQAAAEKMSRINQACSDASFLRTAAVSILGFLGIMFIPFMGLLGICGYYSMIIAVPSLAIRWWVRFHEIETDDPDFRRAKRTVIVISALSALPLAWFVALHV